MVVRLRQLSSLTQPQPQPTSSLQCRVPIPPPSAPPSRERPHRLHHCGAPNTSPSSGAVRSSSRGDAAGVRSGGVALPLPGHSPGTLGEWRPPGAWTPLEGTVAAGFQPSSLLHEYFTLKFKYSGAPYTSTWYIKSIKKKSCTTSTKGLTWSTVYLEYNVVQDSVASSSFVYTSVHHTCTCIDKSKF